MTYQDGKQAAGNSTTRNSTTDEMPACDSSLDAMVEAFEEAWNRFADEVDPLDFIPSERSPSYRSIATEILCIDLERRWRRAAGCETADGQLKSLDSYVRKFPALLADASVRRQLAFEEYRVRNGMGDLVTPAFYADRFDVKTIDWPIMSKADDRATSKAEDARAGAQLPSIGSRVLDFEIGEQLGVCQFGGVFLARQSGLAGRNVVLKFTTQFWRESDCLATLQHTNVVPIYSVHQDGEWQVVCMPFLGRATLGHLLRRHSHSSKEELRQAMLNALRGEHDPKMAGSALSADGDPTRRVDQVRDNAQLRDGNAQPRRANDGPSSRTPGEHADRDHNAIRSVAGARTLDTLRFEDLMIWLALKISSGLAHAHEHGILHRDVKPANILLSHGGQPMLLDFNLSSRVTVDARNRNSSAADAIDSMGEPVGGTLAYMSPEQLHAWATGEGRVDERSDVYALGVVLFEMLTGQLPPTQRPPTSDSSYVAYATRATAARRDRPEIGFDRGVSPSVAAIVRRCLMHDPADRYQSARQLGEDLRRQLEHLPLRYASDRSPVVRTGKWIRRHPTATSLSGLSLIGLVSLAVIVSVLVLRTHRLADLESREAHRRFVEMARLAQASMIIPAKDARGVDSVEVQGKDLAEKTLAIFGATVDQVAHDPSYRRLSEPEQTAVRRLTLELLFLLAEQTASHKAQTPPIHAPRLSEALELNRRAAAFSALERTGGDGRPEWFTRAGAGRWKDAADVLLEQRAILLTLDGRHDRASEIERQLRHRTPIKDDYLVAIARVHRNDVAAARQYLDRLLIDRRDDFLVWLLAGRAAYLAGDLRRAEEAWTYCTSLWPTSHIGYFFRGVTRLDRGFNADAERDFTEAIRWRPSAATYFNRGLAKTRSANFDGALLDLNRSLQLDPKDTRAYLLRSDINRELGHVQQADADQQASLAFQPRDCHAWYERGVARIKHDPAGALDDFDEALQIDPEAGWVWQAKAKTLAGQDKVAEAIEALDRQLELQPDNAAAMIERAGLRQRLGDEVGALQDAHAACDIDSSSENCIDVARIVARAASEELENSLREVMPLLADVLRLEPQRLIELQRDPAFKRFLSHPDFQRVIESIAFVERFILAESSVESP